MREISYANLHERHLIPIFSRVIDPNQMSQKAATTIGFDQEWSAKGVVILVLIFMTTAYYSLQLFKRLHLGLLGFTRRHTISKHLLAFFDVTNKYGVPALDNSSWLHAMTNLAAWSQVRKIVLVVSELVDGR